MYIAIFGEPPPGSTKIAYDWWKRFHDCHSANHSDLRYGDYLQMLFNKGFEKLEGSNAPGDDLRVATDMFSARTKTMKVRVETREIERIKYFSTGLGIPQQEMIGHYLRIGYTTLC